MNKTKIEWCDSTLNPVVGCSFGCSYCYANKLNSRFKWISDWNQPKFFPERLEQLNSKQPKNIFMNSMSDIADWKEEWIIEIAQAIEKNPQHNYLFLTKRIEVISRRLDKATLMLIDRPNVWLGITVTNNDDMKARIYELYRLWSLKCKRFISFEPIFEKINIDFLDYFTAIDWIIIGAETGNRKEKIIPKDFWIGHIVYYAKTRMPVPGPIFMKESMLPVMSENYMLREFPKELIHNV
jgi:protein gp37